MIFTPSNLHFEKIRSANDKSITLTTPATFCRRCKLQKLITKGCKRPMIGFNRGFICADCAQAQ